MNYLKETIALCCDKDNIKQSALFHTYVIPCLNSGEKIHKVHNIIPPHVEYPPDSGLVRDEFLSVAHEILPPMIGTNELKKIYSKAENKIYDLLEFELGGYEWPYSRELDWQLTFIVDYHRNSKPIPITSIHGKMPVLYPVESKMFDPWGGVYSIDNLFNSSFEYNVGIKENIEQTPSVILSNLDLVDANSLTWEQIIEIRKDKDSITALRNLRMFLYKNFKDEKSVAYVEDILLNLIDEYKTTAKKWGFSTLKQSLSIGLNEAMILGVGSSLAALLCKTSFSVAVLAGAVATIGQITINFSERYKEKIENLHNNPVHYIMELNNLSNKNKK